MEFYRIPDGTDRTFTLRSNRGRFFREVAKIAHLSVESIAARPRSPLALHLHDCFSQGWTPEAAANAFLLRTDC